MIDYGAGNDGCEWDPAWSGGEHDVDHQKKLATVIVGMAEWRLCQSCSKLPEFKMFRARRNIGSKP